MPPLTHLVRRDAEGRRHVLASNVDVALLVMGLDLDFNPRRLERYVALVLASGVEPVVVLTKADRVAPGESARAALSATRSRRCSSDSARTARTDRDRRRQRHAALGRGALAPWLGAGRTLVLLGSSGAGKSTLTNTLLRPMAARRCSASRRYASTTTAASTPPPRAPCTGCPAAAA